MQHVITFSRFIFCLDSLHVCEKEASFEPLDLTLGLDQHLAVCKEEVSSEQQEITSSLVQDEPQRPQVKDEENRETESLVSASNEMEKQADVEDSGASQPTSDDQLLFSRNNIMNYDEWEEARQVQATLNALKSRRRNNVNGQTPLSSKLSYFQELKSSKQSKSMKIEIVKKNKKRYKISIIPVSCTVCGKSVYDMNTHMEIHTGRKYFRYRCRICAEGFQHKADYYPHYLKCMHCFHGKLYTGR